jgi:type VI secretion system protein ImpA
MAAPDIEALLKPVSAEQPCGKDLQYSPEFIDFEVLARGRPEQTIGDAVRAAEEPSWPKVRDAAEKLLAVTKDLRVAGILHRALIKTEGLSGFSSSLTLIEELLQRYWEQLYPALDADDNMDPTFRANCLVDALASDPVINDLRQVPLAESRKFGRLSLRQYRIATGVIRVATEGTEHAGDAPAELSRCEAVFQEVDLAILKAAAEAATVADQRLTAIENILMLKAGGIPGQLAAPKADLKDIRALYAAQLAKRGAGPAEAAGQSGQAGVAAGAGPLSGAGQIRSRADVVQALDTICDYYRRNEPSSPIPLLLQRAKRLVDKGFMDIIRDLTPGGISEAEVLGGLEKKDT